MPYSSLLIGACRGAPELKDDLLLTITVVLSTKKYFASVIILIASDDSVDNQATHVPPRLAAVALVRHLSSAPFRSPRLPSYVVLVTNTRFAPGGRVGVGVGVMVGVMVGVGVEVGTGVGVGVGVGHNEERCSTIPTESTVIHLS